MKVVPIVRWQLGNSGFQPMFHARLAEGRMSAPALSPAALSALQKAAGKIVEILGREIQAVQEEFDLASPAALRADPESAKEISFVGQFPPQEARSALLVSARELGNVARRTLSGSLAPYLSEDQVQALSVEKTQADQLVAVLQNQDTMPLLPGHQADVQKYLDMHLGSVTALLQASERGVVEAEAGSVPVLEPAEKFSTTTIVAGIGVATGLGILLWALLS